MPRPNADMCPEGDDLALCAALLGRPVAEAVLLRGGRNSRVYRLVLDDGRVLAAKRYHRSPADPRDRLGAEVGALTFLAEAGVDCVPRPLAADPAAGVAAFEFVEGAHIAPGEGTPADAGAMAAFALRLWELRRLPQARALPLASAACLAPRRLLDGEIARRLAGFERLDGGGEPLPPLPEDEAAELRAFLRGELAPALERFTSDALRELDPAQELAQELRTLSPSDFGLHNALRAPRGLVFLDFEYFGWDDPAKMLCDALLHPGTGLSTEAGRTLASGLAPLHAADPGLDKRVRWLYPLFGINWCLILLNEYLPQARERRRHAGASVAAAARALQLAKARSLLARLNLEHKAFPYDR